jgi:hypothetical protein
MMFGRGRTKRFKKSAVDASELARQLAQDAKFRKRLISAIGHGAKASRRTRGELGAAGAIRRLANNDALLKELRGARDDLQRASRRVQAKRRSHKLRNAALLGGLASLAAVPKLRERVMGAVSNETARRDAADRLRKLVRDHVPAGSGRPPRLEDLTRDELYARAQEAEIPGRSEMSKDELVKALRERR